ncbi:AtpZ/AtpI family protein [Christiangramia portivictoriae]|uniref:AtpZ/AtpI family protein n=1 Tax=Christiangramia portivictoriae TaxID=326069 RepID=UPI000402CA83|nr:AtpZ/AtpI family protein [Christiangramia portivictoriae]
MKNDQRNKYLGFINIAFQMGLLIGAGVFAGIWLDDKFPNKFSVYTISLSLAGVFISLYLVYREVKNLNEDE